MQALTERSALLLHIMFLEPEIMKELIDGSESSLFSRVDIDTEHCRIVLGKTRVKWWNHLINAEKHISIEEFAFKTIGFLGAKASKEGHGNMITQGLLEDVTDALHREGRSNDIIDRLFLVGYMGVKTTWSCLSLGAGSESGGQPSGPIKINIKAGDKRKTFELPGSGDPILNVVLGVKDVDYLGD